MYLYFPKLKNKVNRKYMVLEKLYSLSLYSCTVSDCFHTGPPDGKLVTDRTGRVQKNNLRNKNTMFNEHPVGYFLLSIQFYVSFLLMQESGRIFW